MLVNAKLYEDELKQKDYLTWYDTKYQYVNGTPGTRDLSPQDNTFNTHEFVSIDEDGEVLGFICYEIDWAAKSTCGFCAISYTPGGSTTFARDLYQAIDDIFCKYGYYRMDWHCWADNPAIKGYRKFCKKFGGREVGTLRRKGRLLDGHLHDSVIFELLQEDYIEKKAKREFNKRGGKCQS